MFSSVASKPACWGSVYWRYSVKLSSQMANFVLRVWKMFWKPRCSATGQNSLQKRLPFSSIHMAWGSTFILPGTARPFMFMPGMGVVSRWAPAQ